MWIGHESTSAGGAIGRWGDDTPSEIFLRALDLDPQERTAFLDSACSGDAKLRAELASLLAEEFVRESATGAALTLDEAVAYALGE